MRRAAESAGQNRKGTRFAIYFTVLCSAGPSPACVQCHGSSNAEFTYLRPNHRTAEAEPAQAILIGVLFVVLALKCGVAWSGAREGATVPTEFQVASPRARNGRYRLRFFRVWVWIFKISPCVCARAVVASHTCFCPRGTGLWCSKTDSQEGCKDSWRTTMKTPSRIPRRTHTTSHSPRYRRWGSARSRGTAAALKMVKQSSTWQQQVAT